MRVWTVQVRPPAGRKGPRALLVRDGFSWGALLVPTLWFLWHGLIALALLHGALVIAIAALLPAAAAPFALVGLQLFIGFEARTLHSWWLGLRGFRPAAVLVARNADAAFLNLAAYRPDLARAAV
jgi:phosphoglycerol transferase MdoB-like AlkP superfamily enzyme